MALERELAEAAGELIESHQRLVLGVVQHILASDKQNEKADLGFEVLAPEPDGWVWGGLLQELREWYDTLPEPGED